MLLVEVVHAGLSDELQQRLKELLKEAVAEELDCSDIDPDSALEPDDINVRFRSYGPNDDDEFAVDVLVIAKHFDARAEKLDEATSEIRNRLCSNLSDLDRVVPMLGVFVTLPVSGWALGYPGD